MVNGSINGYNHKRGERLKEITYKEKVPYIITKGELQMGQRSKCEGQKQKCKIQKL